MEVIDKIRRYHDVAESQRREQNFAERSDVDHAGVRVEALQRGDGLAFVAVLAVVIVFDDPRAGALSPFDQLQTARSAHGDAERKLVRRGHERGAGLRKRAYAGSNVEAFTVHWYGNDVASVDSERHRGQGGNAVLPSKRGRRNSAGLAS